MKKLMNIFVLVAAAAMTLASCQKNEIDGPVKQEVHFTINAGIAETKTIITDNGDGTYTPSWTGDEQLGVLFSAPNGDTKACDVVSFENTSEAGETASFQGSTTVTENGTFYSFYPASAFSRGYAQGDARLDLKSVQKPSATSFDPSCDILVAKPYDYEVIDGQVVVDELYFKRLMSVLRIDLNTDFEDVKNEVVESVSFTAGDVKIVGYARVFLDNPDFTTQNWASSGDDYCTVTATYDTDVVSVAGADNSVYMVIAPVTIPAGKELTFEVKTKNYTISKTVTVPAEMKFAAGNVNKINLTIKEDNCTAKAEDTSDYSGEWLIAGKEGETWYAAQKYVSGNYLSVTTLEFEGESILESDGLSDCYMHIEKVVGGDYDGMYTIKDAGGKYLSTSSSSSNNMKAVTDLDANSYWDIDANDDGETYSLIATKSSFERNDMRFNYNNGSPRVSCYDGSKTGLPYLKLFSESLVKADTTPRITVEDTEYNVSADDETLEFSYNTKNIDGTPTVSVADGATMTNVEADAEAGIVTVIFDANAEEVEKTATLVLSYEGAESVSVTITQAAKAAAGGAYYEKVTSAPADSDWSGTYLIVANTNVATVIEGTWLKFASVEINDNKIESTDIIDAYAVTIEKVSSQSYYTIKLANGQYLGTPNSNSIKQNASAGTDFYWKFSLADDLVKIEANAYSGRILRLNGTSGFRTYTSTIGTQATLYKLIGGEGGETPEPTPDPEEPGENITISVDFESDTYSDWTTTNMQLKQTGEITAKEGTYYGTTGGKGSASIATKKTYASPKSITCYVSKQSNNTNTSSIWKIEVSTGGNTWTEVKTQAATSMAKGTWVEFTADLSTYTNVYVRVSYDGTTAVRNIDALTFTYSE